MRPRAAVEETVETRFEFEEGAKESKIWSRQERARREAEKGRRRDKNARDLARSGKKESTRANGEEDERKWEEKEGGARRWERGVQNNTPKSQ